MVIFGMQSVTQLLTDVAGFFNTYLCSCILFLMLNHFAASDPQALKLRDKSYRRVRKMLLGFWKCDLVCCALWGTMSRLIFYIGDFYSFGCYSFKIQVLGFANYSFPVGPKPLLSGYLYFPLCSYFPAILSTTDLPEGGLLDRDILR